MTSVDQRGELFLKRVRIGSGSCARDGGEFCANCGWPFDAGDPAYAAAEKDEDPHETTERYCSWRCAEGGAS